MQLLKKLMVEEDGQGLVEYALIVLLVVFVFWVTIKNTNIGNQLSASWTNIGFCLATPTGCTASSICGGCSKSNGPIIIASWEGHCESSAGRVLRSFLD